MLLWVAAVRCVNVFPFDFCLVFCCYHIVAVTDGFQPFQRRRKDSSD